MRLRFIFRFLTKAISAYFIHVSSPTHTQQIKAKARFISSLSARKMEKEEDNGCVRKIKKEMDGGCVKKVKDHDVGRVLRRKSCTPSVLNIF